MTKKELLNKYRALRLDLEELHRQMRRVGTDGRPAAYHSPCADRIGRATNNASAAAIHLSDGLEKRAQYMEENLRTLGEQVDTLLSGIQDYRTYTVIERYYVLAETDEQIGQLLCLSKARVNQLRLEYLRSA